MWAPSLHLTCLSVEHAWLGSVPAAAQGPLVEPPARWAVPAAPSQPLGRTSTAGPPDSAFLSFVAATDLSSGLGMCALCFCPASSDLSELLCSLLLP